MNKKITNYRITTTKNSYKVTEAKKKKKKSNTLCARGKSAAKAKYDVYPFCLRQWICSTSL